MKSIRSTKSVYAAAFVLGVLIALLITRPLRAAALLTVDCIGDIPASAVDHGRLPVQQLEA
jgi:hypothetical protein